MKHGLRVNHPVGTVFARLSCFDGMFIVLSLVSNTIPPPLILIMNSRILLAVFSLLTLFVSTVPVSANDNEKTSLNSVIEFASPEEGRILLSTEDPYTAKWSAFDILSRSQMEDGTKDDVLKMMKDQVLAWTEEEESRIRTVLTELDTIISQENYHLPLPATVRLIKSTLMEEGGAEGYTRENYIVLRSDLIFREDDMLKDVLLHELFHIMSRHDAEFRKAAYEVIGFTVSNPVAYPSEIANLKITNPDAHTNDSYIRLETKKDSIPLDAVMILFAKEPWRGGSFFTYLDLGFMAVDGPDGEKKAVYKDGKALIYNIGEIFGFLEQVGWNTQYVIDPEEISAENFALVFEDDGEHPSPEIIEGIRNVLLQP